MFNHFEYEFSYSKKNRAMYKVKRFSIDRNKAAIGLGVAGVGSILGGQAAGKVYGSLKNTDKDYEKNINDRQDVINSYKSQLERMNKLKKSGKWNKLNPDEFNDYFDDYYEYEFESPDDYYEYVKRTINEEESNLNKYKSDPKSAKKLIRRNNMNKYADKGLSIGAAIGIPMMTASAILGKKK